MFSSHQKSFHCNEYLNLPRPSRRSLWIFDRSGHGMYLSHVPWQRRRSSSWRLKGPNKQAEGILLKHYSHRVRLSTNKNLIYTATTVKYLDTRKLPRFKFEVFKIFSFRIECRPIEFFCDDVWSWNTEFFPMLRD